MVENRRSGGIHSKHVQVSSYSSDSGRMGGNVCLRTFVWTCLLSEDAFLTLS